jgi:hypothetical protein
MFPAFRRILAPAWEDAQKVASSVYKQNANYADFYMFVVGEHTGKILVYGEFRSLEEVTKNGFYMFDGAIILKSNEQIQFHKRMKPDYFNKKFVKCRKP